ncbi:MAG: hypothetical protein QXU44_09605 [Candidatus Caldarchaeum sp.]
MRSKTLFFIVPLIIVFVYGEQYVPVDPYVVDPPPAVDALSPVVGRGFVLNMSRLVRGVYNVKAYWPDLNGVQVGLMVFDRFNGRTTSATLVKTLQSEYGVSQRTCYRQLKN